MSWNGFQATKWQCDWPNEIQALFTCLFILNLKSNKNFCAQYFFFASFLFPSRKWRDVVVQVEYHVIILLNKSFWVYLWDFVLIGLFVRMNANTCIVAILLLLMMLLLLSCVRFFIIVVILTFAYENTYSLLSLI